MNVLAQKNSSVEKQQKNKTAAPRPEVPEPHLVSSISTGVPLYLRLKLDNQTDFREEEHVDDNTEMIRPKLQLVADRPTSKLQRENQGTSAEIAEQEEEAEVLQTKIEVGQSDDAFEREADEIADRVMRMANVDDVSTTEPGIQRKCSACSQSSTSICSRCETQQQAVQLKALSSPVHRRSKPAAGIGLSHSQLSHAIVQRQCGACASGEKPCAQCETKQLGLQLKTNSNKVLNKTSRPNKADPIAKGLAAGGGGPLGQSGRNFFEPRFGRDFNAVRIHTDSEAVAMNRLLGARAFTYGTHIYFNRGQFDSSSYAGRHLLAHELTHVVQQASGRVAPKLQRYSWNEFTSDVGSAADAAGDVVDSAGEAIGDAAQAFGEVAVAAGEAIVDVGSVVVDVAADAASDALNWLASEAGEYAKALVGALGGSISITSAGLVVTLPKICPIPAKVIDVPIDPISKEKMIPVFVIPIGSVAVTVSLGVKGTVVPQIQLQVGPFCLEGASLTINPVTNTYSISGSVSATAAGSIGAEIRGGIKGSVGIVGVIPIGGVPIPIEAELIAAEGGIAGMFRGIGAGKYTMGGSLSYAGGALTLSSTDRLDIGLAGDLFLGAYAQLDILGKNVCRIYWQPYEWHGGVGISISSSSSLTIGASGATVTSSASDPVITDFPFDNFDLALSREGFKDDCPIIDKICEVLKDLNLLPSQHGGVWGGTYGPGPRLPGPLDAYQRDPGIPSGAHCRGACGPDCVTCQPSPNFRYPDPDTGELWEYDNMQICPTHDGCRQHDAAFDWAADKKGETGDWAIVYPWHMAANIECACNNLAGNCIAWIAGAPPHDEQPMYFADGATKAVAGPGGVDQCKDENPGALDCSEGERNRQLLLEIWGSEYGFEEFGDFNIHQDFGPAEQHSCGTSSGRLWRGHARDVITSYRVEIELYSCICCDETGVPGVIWRDPHLVVSASALEVLWNLCQRGLLPAIVCEDVRRRIFEKFGSDSRRNMDIDPDKDVNSPEDARRRRPDDAPILDSFHRIYNRLDSWQIFIHTNHSGWTNEFDSTFFLNERRSRWLADLKSETKDYKSDFRDLSAHDTGAIRADYQRNTLRRIERLINDLVREIALWYQFKTGSRDNLDDIIERVHAEGTELWRQAWQRAVVAVNLVLARLWPVAKNRIVNFIVMQRGIHPGVDLSGSIGDVSYIGSTAIGYKGPPKQYIRFNPEKFDVDANLAAPPLAKYAVNIDGATPDRGRILDKETSIVPLRQFSDQAHQELAQNVDGYDTSDPFQVAIQTPDTPEQSREAQATNRIYTLRDDLDEALYQSMINELRAEALVAWDLEEGGQRVRKNLTAAEFQRLTQILDRYSDALVAPPGSGVEFNPGERFQVAYSVPLVKMNIQASAGEQMIFGVIASDKDRSRAIGSTVWSDIDPGTGPYEILYEVQGEADLMSAGSGTKSHVDPTLRSRNIYLFINRPWSGSTITVTATVKDKASPAVSPDIGATRDIDHSIIWTIVQRANACPTGLNRVSGAGSSWVSAPSSYGYQATPEINPPGRPNYENQTVLESFPGIRPLFFTMSDLKASWKAANPTINTPGKVASFFWGISGNGTFVFDNDDKMYDQHSGFGSTSAFTATALGRASGIGYSIDQDYTCAGTNIGTAVVDRKHSTARGTEIRKTGP